MAGHRGQLVHARLLQTELVDALGQVEGANIPRLALLGKVLPTFSDNEDVLTVSNDFRY